jgi:hypothetical protein
MSTSAPVKILAEDEGCSARGNDGGGGGGGGGGRGVVAGGGRRKPGRNKLGDVTRPAKRRCVSSACIACRRRKSKARPSLFFLDIYSRLIHPYSIQSI